MDQKDKYAISFGCIVGLYCSIINEYNEFKIVKNRDTVEYKPLFSGAYGIQNNSVAVTHVAEYADDEVVEGCKLVDELIGKRLGDSFIINEYNYKIEKIVLPDGKKLELKEKFLNKPQAEPKPVHNGIDWESGFATECTESELQLIRSFEEFMKKEFSQFVGSSRMNRIVFYDPNIKLDGVQYSQFWFIKRSNILMFRYKLNQNENDEIKYGHNILIADSVQFESIKILVRLILKT